VRLSAEELAEYATQYGLSALDAQRDYVAIRVAHAMTSDAEVGERFALKGGFILRYGYGSPRTSKDIDATIGTQHDRLDPGRLQRSVRGECADLSLTFDPRTPRRGVDTLDFGNVNYAGPLGRGFLTIEMSYREDLILPPRRVLIDSFGVPPFRVRALAIDEMIAEKWRCLVQRSPRRPGDLYDLWYLWCDVRERAPASPEDVISPGAIRNLVPRKVDWPEGAAGLVSAVDRYQPTWASAVGDTLPGNSPSFAEARAAVLEAGRAWTPWR
jgi:predicted nucleotidyltransferase component of viral defense system